MLPEKTLIDVMRGYPKAKAVELAVRTLSPEIIVCDEIGDESECRALLETAGSGVPIIASAHGKSLTDLLSRPQIKRLFENGVFEIALGIERKAGSTVFEYEICEFEEGKACCTRK